MLIGVMERHAMQPRSRQLALILNHPRIPNRPQNHPPTHSKLATKAVRRARIARVAHARQRLGSRGATPRISACRRKGSELGRAVWLLRTVRPGYARSTSARQRKKTTVLARRLQIARVDHARRRLGGGGATSRISASRRKGSILGRAAWLLRIVRPALALRTSVRRQQVGASILVGNGSLFMAWTPQTETQTQGAGGSRPNILFKIIFAFSPAWLVTI